MNIIKKLIIAVSTLVLFCASSMSQNYTITDLGDMIQFRAADAYHITVLDKSEISAIETVSSTEVRVVPRTSNVKPFSIDYVLWSTNGDSTFDDVSDLHATLLKMKAKRYLVDFSYDGSDNLIERKIYFTYNGDTILISFESDTLIYDGSNLDKMYPQELE
jgi:hypothetical protein